MPIDIRFLIAKRLKMKATETCISMDNNPVCSDCCVGTKRQSLECAMRGICLKVRQMTHFEREWLLRVLEMGGCKSRIPLRFIRAT